MAEDISGPRSAQAPSGGPGDEPDAVYFGAWQRVVARVGPLTDVSPVTPKAPPEGRPK